MIHVVAVLTAFLSGTLLGVVLDTIRVRRRQVEENARKVAEALADTVLVNGVLLPKPEDERWEAKDITYGGGRSTHSLVLGQVVVGGSATDFGRDYVCVGGQPISGIKGGINSVEANYVRAVWTAYQTRLALKSIR